MVNCHKLKCLRNVNEVYEVAIQDHTCIVQHHILPSTYHFLLVVEFLYFEARKVIETNKVLKKLTKGAFLKYIVI